MMLSFKSTKRVLPPGNSSPTEVRNGSSRLLYGLSAFISIGALLFGYDQGVMGVIVADSRWLHLTQPKNSWVTGAVVSLYDIGCFIGAFSTGFLSDSLGRERLISRILFGCSNGVGRVILGYGVGACAAGVPLYLSEIAPAKLRGRLIGIEQMVLNFGEMVAFWANYGLSYLNSNDWWRIPIAIQILPAIVLGVGYRRDEAYEALIRLHGTDQAIIEMDMLNQVLDVEKLHGSKSWADILTFLAMMLQSFQQITGTNSILYYTPTLFRKGGISDAHIANLATGGVGIVLFVSSFVPIFYFDRLGRRTWLKFGTIGMMCAMIGITVLQWHAEKFPGSKGNYAIVAFPDLFYICFNISWGVAAWVYPSEIFPNNMRARGNALGSASNWISCYVVAQVSPAIADAINWGLYIIYAGICCLAYLFVQFMLVETKGVSLEAMSLRFGLERRTQ
ncbi:general substrate transporter [Lipomyces tetrasporus]|uniref:General substrate transporter n=1 Tax=Lipomyces tetrasporus TaxID=54092 RepID=A0AAD7QJZ8_9ASCO|nr:general substrate transporter [Lipomyces tetrasporus]KAJ8096613.1 general substrate transporter [Lipomyces tetrasporus]